MAEGRPDEQDNEVALFHVDDFGAQVKRAFVERYVARHQRETQDALSAHPYTEEALKRSWNTLFNKADAVLQRTPVVHHLLLPVLEAQKAKWFSRSMQEAVRGKPDDADRPLHRSLQLVVFRIIDRVVATLPYPFTMAVTPEVLNKRPQEWFLVEIAKPLHSMEELQGKKAADLQQLCEEHGVEYGGSAKRARVNLLQVPGEEMEKVWITLQLFTEESLAAAMAEFYDTCVERLVRFLNSRVGLAKVKEKVRELLAVAGMELDLGRMAVARREQLSLAATSISHPGHMRFVGDPGTGKTTMAEQFGTLFWLCGVLSYGHTVGVHGTSLTGHYMGRDTADGVKVTVAAAYGGVWFVDEAHQLATQREYAQSAAATINQLALSPDAPLMIVAGYEKELETAFFSLDRGLASRFEVKVLFEPYEAMELAQIFRAGVTEQVARLHHITVDDVEDGVIQTLSDKFLENVEGSMRFWNPDAGNARAVNSISRQLWKEVAKRSVGAPGARMVTEGDVEMAIKWFDETQPEGTMPPQLEEEEREWLVRVTHLSGRSLWAELKRRRLALKADLKAARVKPYCQCPWCQAPAFKLLDHLYCGDCDWNHPAVCNTCKVHPVKITSVSLDFICPCGQLSDFTDVLVFDSAANAPKFCDPFLKLQHRVRTPPDNVLWKQIVKIARKSGCEVYGAAQAVERVRLRLSEAVEDDDNEDENEVAPGDEEEEDDVEAAENEEAVLEEQLARRRTEVLSLLTFPRRGLDIAVSFYISGREFMEREYEVIRDADDEEGPSAEAIYRHFQESGGLNAQGKPYQTWSGFATQVIDPFLALHELQRQKGAGSGTLPIHGLRKKE